LVKPYHQTTIANGMLMTLLFYLSIADAVFSYAPRKPSVAYLGMGAKTRFIDKNSIALPLVQDFPDDTWRMIDGSHTKVHPHAAAPKGGNQEMSRSKGGSTPRCTQASK
jgi:hypothetical protein